MKTTTIYKNAAAKAEIMALYDAKLASLKQPTASLWVETPQGRTHVLRMGSTQLPPMVVFHGINAGAPLTLEAMEGLADDFCLYAIDTIGQATRSAEVRLPLVGPALGQWAKAVVNGLGLQKAVFVGISYGAFLLQKFMQVAPECIEKAAFVVPSGLVNGPFWASMTKLSWPLMRFHLTKREQDLQAFLKAFHSQEDPFWSALHRALLLGTKMDYRRPPLLQKRDVQALQAPVYALVAEEDVFFPGEAALARCRDIFPNFAGSAVLQGAKHMPMPERYAEIQQQLRQWLKNN